MRKGSVQKTPNFDRAMSEEFTAKDSSMGNSGGTTEVRIKVHSKKSLYLFLFGSSLPEKLQNIIN